MLTTENGFDLTTHNNLIYLLVREAGLPGGRCRAGAGRSCSAFNAILTEKAKIDERKDNKRKFLESKSRQQDRFQKPRSFSYNAPRSQAQCSTELSLK